MAGHPTYHVSTVPLGSMSGPLLFSNRKMSRYNLLFSFFSDWFYKGFLRSPTGFHKGLLSSGKSYEKPLCQKIISVAKVHKSSSFSSSSSM